MNKEIAKIWIKDLKENGDLQGVRYLHRIVNGEQRFCCLGRLCVLAINAGVEVDVKNTEHNTVEYGLHKETLPESVQKWAGMKYKDGSYMDDCKARSLATENDRGVKFAEIADIIEANVENL